MKKIILTLITLSSLMFGEVVVGKEYRINNRNFQYYCVDGILYLETYTIRATDNVIKFEQVYQQSTPNGANRSIPRECYIKDNEFYFNKGH